MARNLVQYSADGSAAFVDERTGEAQGLLPLRSGAVVNAEAADVIAVEIFLRDGNGRRVAGAKHVSAYLTSESAGDTIDTVDSIVENGNGVAVGTPTTSQIDFLTGANGDAQLDLTFAGGAKTSFLNLVLPNGYVETFTLVWA